MTPTTPPSTDVVPVQSSEIAQGLASYLAGKLKSLVVAAPVIAPGLRVPDWSLSDVQGRLHAPSRYAGRSYALVFGATWCVPCQWMVPDWQKLHSRYYPTGFRVLSIYAKETVAVVRAHQQLHKLNYFCCPSTEKMMRDFGVYVNGVGTLPRVVLVGSDGLIRHEFRYYHTLAWLDGIIGPMTQPVLPAGGASAN